MKEIDAVLSRKLSRLSCVAVILVVFLHSYNKNLHIGFTFWLQDFVSQGLTRVAVPYFFCVSGFLLFRGYPGTEVSSWWCRQVRKRLSSLVIPYFFWGLFSLVYSFLIINLATVKLYAFHWHDAFWWLRVVGLVGEAPLFGYHLWYLKTLFVAVLLSPLVGFLISKKLGWWIVIIGFILCQAPGSGYGSKLCLMFFSLGGTLAIRGIPQRISRTVEDHPIQTGIFSTLVWAVISILHIYVHRGVLSCDWNFLVIGNCAGLITLWILYDLVPNCLWKGIDCVVPCSFFVYCAHGFGYVIVGKILSFLPLGPLTNFVGWIAPPLVIVSSLTLVFRMMLHKTPRFLSLILGGRI